MISDWSETEVDISGGTFKAEGASSEIVVKEDQSTGTKATSTVAISGGSYNKAVAEDYMAEGFEMKDDGTGNFTPTEKEDPDVDPDDPVDPEKPVDLTKKASSRDILIFNSITMPPYNYENKDWRRKV